MMNGATITSKIFISTTKKTPKKNGISGRNNLHKRQIDAKSLSTNKLILIAPCAILSSRKNNGGKHGNDKAENMGNNG